MDNNLGDRIGNKVQIAKDKIMFYLIKNKSNKYLVGRIVASVYSGRSHNKRVL